jgi:(p)ppGpp synthase/HD superfamily hydrolase
MNQLFVPRNRVEQKALDVATYAHDGQYRKGSDKQPYIVHPKEVASILAESGASSAAVVAGLLHDVLEDVDPAKYCGADMHCDFGGYITELVKTVSKPNKNTGDWLHRNEVYLGQITATPHLEALEVCAADKLSNISATLADYTASGEDLWVYFNAGKDQQKWWYSAVHAVLETRIADNKIVCLLGQQVLKLQSI